MASFLVVLYCKDQGFVFIISGDITTTTITTLPVCHRAASNQKINYLFKPIGIGSLLAFSNIRKRFHHKLMRSDSLEVVSVS